MLDESQRQRLEDLFALGSELPPEERATFCERHCALDPEFRRELESLLEVESRAPGSFLKAPVISSPPTPTEASNSAPASISPPGQEGAYPIPTPERIGPYRILEVIGEGGMGIVYLAQQTEPVSRKVALKVVKPGMDTRQVVARFEAERQALALMDHPCIARIYDGGATGEGRPFFVMEHVVGLSLTEHCDRKRSTTRERLELFCRVCDAVQHAHQKGIIHRDLKPSNILVAEQDGQARPKVIDFGIARATVQPLTEKTLFTRQGEVVGTFHYMSPEQADPAGLDVDSRADIYSLGVILYELISGALPFEAESFRDKPMSDVQRMLREQDPTTPSSRVTIHDAGSGELANRHGTDVRNLKRQLRGDLDWITLRALERDRSRRYASASELAADVRRHLAHKPVLAGPPGLGYRLGKFARRHRVGVAASLLVVSALVVGAVLATWGLVQASREREAAENAHGAAREEARRSRDMFRFLAEDVLRVPDVAHGEAITLKSVLDRAASRIDAVFADDAAARETLHQKVGHAYRALGHADLAAQEFLQLNFANLEDSDPEAAYEIAMLGVRTSDVSGASAKALAVRVLFVFQRKLLERCPELAPLWGALKPASFSHVDLEHLWPGILEKARGLAATDAQAARLLGWVFHGYSVIAQWNNLSPELCREWRRASVALGEPAFRDDHPELAMRRAVLGLSEYMAGRSEEACGLWRQARRACATLAEGDPRRLHLEGLCAIERIHEGDFDAARQVLRRAYDALLQAGGPRDQRVAVMAVLLKWLNDRQGRKEDAARWGQRFLEAGGSVMGAIDCQLWFYFQGEHPPLADALVTLRHRSWSRVGDPLAACEALERHRRRVLDATHPANALVGERLLISGIIYRRLGPYPAAQEEWLRRSLRLYLCQQQARSRFHKRSGAFRLALWLESRGRRDDAIQLLREVLERLVAISQEGAPAATLFRARLAETLLRAGRPAEAAPLLKVVGRAMATGPGSADLDLHVQLPTLWTITRSPSLPSSLHELVLAAAKAIGRQGVQDPDLLRTQALAHYRAGRHEDCLQELEDLATLQEAPEVERRAIEHPGLTPDAFRVLLQRSEVLTTTLRMLACEKLGRTGAVEQTWEQLEQLAEKNSQAMRWPFVPFQKETAIWTGRHGPAREALILLLQDRAPQLAAGFEDLANAIIWSPPDLDRCWRAFQAIPGNALASEPGLARLCVLGFYHLGWTVLYRQNPEVGEAMLTWALDLARSVYPTGHQRIAALLWRLAWRQERQGDWQRGETFATECVAIRAKLDPGSRETANAECLLGGCLLGQGRLAEAAPLIEGKYEKLMAQWGPASANTLQAFRRLVELEIARQRRPAATALLDRVLRVALKGTSVPLLQTLSWYALRDAAFPPELHALALEAAHKAWILDSERAGASFAYGAALVRAGRHEEALTILGHADEQRGSQRQPCDHTFRAMAFHRLGREREARSALEQAAALLRGPCDTVENRALLEEARAGGAGE